jgi:P27 family predicted phage terminase small subunit
VKGRKPKPTALKKLAGNPGKRPLNGGEPRMPVPARTPRVPPYLSKYAKKEWRRMVKMLLNAGLYTEADQTALAMYCQAYGRWRQAEEELDKQNKLMYETDKGYHHQSPLVSITARYWEQMRKMLAEFGLTPSSRSRMTFDPPDEEDDLAKLLFRRRVKVAGDDE